MHDFSVFLRPDNITIHIRISISFSWKQQYSGVAVQFEPSCLPHGPTADSAPRTPSASASELFGPSTYNTGDSYEHLVFDILEKRLG
jgi:hypothetical protein